jgi:hypothetical protein
VVKIKLSENNVSKELIQHLMSLSNREKLKSIKKSQNPIPC